MAQYLAGRGLQRAGVPAWPWYLGLACFRLAAISQGVYARSRQGNASASTAGEYHAVAAFMAGLGWALVRTQRAIAPCVGPASVPAASGAPPANGVAKFAGGQRLSPRAIALTVLFFLKKK